MALDPTSPVDAIAEAVPDQALFLATNDSGQANHSLALVLVGFGLLAAFLLLRRAEEV
jgi:hypothetical protein